jgi:F-type H+-transporting ATPase subunit delta
MQNLRVTGRYAKSLIDLASEKNSLEQVHQDMLFLQRVCLASRDFVAMLRSPVINSDKKLRVMEQIGAGRIGPLTAAFNALLVRKGRESELPGIIDAFVEQYNRIKGIHTVKLTTAAAIGEDVQGALRDKIRRDTALENVVLETGVNEDLIGGFTLEFDGKMVDASVARELRDIRKQFTRNAYIPVLK